MRHTLITLAASLILTAATATAVAQVTTGYVRMGVALPLKERSPRGVKMVEFYQGLLMAVDSMKHQGCAVSVVAHHCGSTAAQMDSLLATNPFVNCDVVFGPLDAAQIPALTDYCALKGIRLVVPFSALTTAIDGHPRNYLVNVPRSMVQKEAAWFAQNLFSDENIVIVDCNESNDEGNAMAERLRMTMDERGIEVRQVKVDADDYEFDAILNPDKKNVLLPNSASLGALNALRERMRSFASAHPGFSISFFGYPAWQTYTSQIQSDLFQFDTYVYTPFYRDAQSPDVLQFEQSFEQNFSWPVQRTFPRYALLGFDVGYYFLKGLGQFGKDFEANLVATVTQPLQNPLRFERTDDGDGYVNTFVQLVHYANYQAVEILYRNQ
ncbi:MAG: hypothetical protein IJ209_08310 [Bacteroidaceae bacterium]|nr:hypothetical protein [Bacteroidaceae bacterium]